MTNLAERRATVIAEAPEKRRKLTKRFVNSVAVPKAGAGDVVIWDSDLPGFGLRVKASMSVCGPFHTPRSKSPRNCSHSGAPFGAGVSSPLRKPDLDGRTRSPQWAMAIPGKPHLTPGGRWAASNAATQAKATRREPLPSLPGGFLVSPLRTGPA